VVLLRQLPKGHFILSSLSDASKPVFPSYSLTVPLITFPSIWPRHSLGTTPTIFNFIFFSQERAPSALAAIGNICSPYTHLFSATAFYHLLNSRGRTTLYYILDTFFRLQDTLFDIHVSLTVHFLPCFVVTDCTMAGRCQTWGQIRSKAEDHILPNRWLTVSR
jgi:hypothetical protein